MSQPVRRVSAGRLERLSAEVTATERAVLEVLGLVRAARTDQLAQVVFTGSSAGRLARRALHHLRVLGLVRRYPDRSRDRKVGAQGHVHALSAAGLRFVQRHHGIGVRQRRAWQPSPDFIAHRLAITELYVRLIEQERAGGPTVREFNSEPDCWRRYSGPSGEQLLLRPDALVRLVHDGFEISWFVEIDRATETRPATIAEKCHQYLKVERSGQEQRRHGVFPGVAFVVPDDARAREIERTLARLPREARSLFAVMTIDSAPSALAELEVAA